MEIEVVHNNPMTAPRVDEDEPESDDQEPPMWNTPLNAKHPLKLEDFDESENTGMTSPCSSSKTHSSLQSRDFTIQFCDDHNIQEIDCDYTDEQVSKLWFTKEEYDFFLEECDEDAQKHEEWEKETRVNKLKKEIRRQRRQRQKEDKRTPRIRAAEVLDESINSQANFEIDEYDCEDDSDDDESSVPEYDEDQDGWMCPLGLEAWTLDGYKARELHRQKAIDSVLVEQYAAWDRGMVENMEMMSALYFAASAISKHEAHKKAKELEEDIQQQVIVSTLEDYNKAVQTLNVLQKSLACIKSKQNAREASKVESRPLARRRGSTGGIGAGSVAPRRGSTGSMGSESAISSMASPEIDRTLALSEHSLDQAPQLPTKSYNPPQPSYPPQTASSSSARKKPKQRKNNDSASQKVYKSKAQMDIIFMPPTPPVTTKKPAVVYKPSKGGLSKGGPPKEFDLMVVPLTKSPKHRKIVYKPVVDGPPKVEGSRVSRSSETETTKKKKKKTKETTTKPKKRTSKSERPRSQSPRPRELNSKARRRSKSPCPSNLYADCRPRPRSKSPHSSEARDSSSKHSRSSDFDRERRRSKSPHARVAGERLRSKSPRAKALERPRSKSPRASSISPKDSKESSIAGKFLKKMGSTGKSRTKAPTKTSTKGYTPLSNHTNNSPHQSSKKEHWWYQQQRQACQ